MKLCSRAPGADGIGKPGAFYSTAAASLDAEPTWRLTGGHVIALNPEHGEGRTVKRRRAAMTIHEQLILDVALLHLSGRVTLTDGADVLGETLQRLAEQGHLKIVLDLLDVPYIDSTALGAILRAYTT